MRGAPYEVGACFLGLLFDYALTGVIPLTNERWFDLAHLLFIPLIGVHRYLLLRALLFPLALWAFKHAGCSPFSMQAVKALTVFLIHKTV